MCLFNWKNKRTPPAIPVETEFQQLVHTIHSQFNGFITFNGKIESIDIQTIISVLVKKQGNKRWYEMSIDQPDVLIKEPFYDCEFATNRSLSSILALDMLKAQKWVAENCKTYKQIADIKGIKFIIPWK